MGYDPAYSPARTGKHRKRQFCFWWYGRRATDAALGTQTATCLTRIGTTGSST